MQMPSDLLERGQQQYSTKLKEPGRQSITDPVITPFVYAMKLGGYEELLNKTCSITRRCPFCNGSYSQKYSKDDRLVWGCPHCNSICIDGCEGDEVAPNTSSKVPNINFR